MQVMEERNGMYVYGGHRLVGKLILLIPLLSLAVVAAFLYFGRMETSGQSLMESDQGRTLAVVMIPSILFTAGIVFFVSRRFSSFGRVIVDPSERNIQFSDSQVVQGSLSLGAMKLYKLPLDEIRQIILARSPSGVAATEVRIAFPDADRTVFSHTDPELVRGLASDLSSIIGITLREE